MTPLSLDFWPPCIFVKYVSPQSRLSLQKLSTTYFCLTLLIIRVQYLLRHFTTQNRPLTLFFVVIVQSPKLGGESPSRREKRVGRTLYTLKALAWLVVKGRWKGPLEQPHPLLQLWYLFHQPLLRKCAKFFGTHLITPTCTYTGSAHAPDGLAHNCTIVQNFSDGVILAKQKIHF